MLTEVALHDFKCFEALRLELAPLTILTGYNAAGKSTSIQPLLLIAQSLRTSSVHSRIELNGEIVRLGTAGEVIAVSAREKQISVAFRSGESSLELDLGAADTIGASALQVRNVRANYATAFGQQSHRDQIADFDELLRQLIYLGASRIGTPDVMPIPDLDLVHGDVGASGQFAAWWYSQFADEEVAEERRHPAEEGLTLRRQLDAYLSDLFPGGQANAEQIHRTSFSRLTFRLSSQSDWLRPSNIGYGLSYAFPILIALLLAKVGQIVVIDSPEAHLHPHGQSQMGKILARFAAAGVQVIIETHSDHVLNGARLSVRESTLAPESVAVHFFQGRRDAESGNGIQSLRIDRNGAIDAWPVGFFDQAEHDLSVLSGFEP